MSDDMVCKKCGGDLPYGAYGRIKCDYCGAVNVVQLPDSYTSGEPPSQPIEAPQPEPVRTSRSETKINRKFVRLQLVGALLGFAASIDLPFSQYFDFQSRRVIYIDFWLVLSEGNISYILLFLIGIIGFGYALLVTINNNLRTLDNVSIGENAIKANNGAILSLIPLSMGAVITLSLGSDLSLGFYVGLLSALIIIISGKKIRI